MQDQAKKEMLILVVDDEPVMTNALGKVFSIQYNANHPNQHFAPRGGQRQRSALLQP